MYQKTKIITTRDESGSLESQIGSMPLIRQINVSRDRPLEVEVHTKAKQSNPGGSVTDAAARTKIIPGEMTEQLRPRTSLLDAMSENTASVSLSLSIGSRSAPLPALRIANTEQAFFVVGINHRTASIEALESVHIHEIEYPALVFLLKKSLTECVVISTCNRTEIYGVSRSFDLDLEMCKTLLIQFGSTGLKARHEQFYGLTGKTALHHLFKVASSIDSKIIGDTQILGQLRRSYAIARQSAATGKITNQIFQNAFKVGKKIRTCTDLHKGAVSISLAAVELAVKTVGSLSNKTVLILGAGKTSTLTAECLVQKGIGRLLVANRTRSRAETLVSRLNYRGRFESAAIDISDLRGRMDQVDVVITATSSREPILKREHFSQQAKDILLIDLAMPRDIEADVAVCKNVTLMNLGDLHDRLAYNHQRRMAELPLVKRIIEAEIIRVQDRLGSDLFRQTTNL